MIELLLRAVSLGLLIAVLVGPVFFLLISTSINKGFVQAFYLALGISACDTIYILLIYLGIAQFASNPHLSVYMSVVGGGILIVFGFTMILKKPKTENTAKLENQKAPRFRYFFQGFFLNLINPSVCIFWLGAVGIVSTRYHNEANLILLFFLFTIMTILFTDMIKIYLAKKISAYLTSTTLHRINQICGVGMVIFGIYLLIEKFRSGFLLNQ